MKSTPEDIQAYMQLLSDYPDSIADLTAAGEPRHLESLSVANEWTVPEILAHLRSCADIWTFSIYAMLVEDQPSLPNLHPRNWNKITRYEDLDYHRSLEAFLQQRYELINVLGKLKFEAWERRALIADRDHTIFSQVRRMAKHEGDHLAQIEHILNPTEH